MLHRRIASLWQNSARSEGRWVYHRRLALEPLEDRTLLTASSPASAFDQSDNLTCDVSDSTPWATVDLATGTALADRLIVRFADSITDCAASQLVSSLGGSVETLLPIIHGAVVKLTNLGSNLLDVAASWDAAAEIVYAEPNYVVYGTQVPK